MTKKNKSIWTRAIEGHIIQFWAGYLMAFAIFLFREEYPGQDMNLSSYGKFGYLMLQGIFMLVGMIIFNAAYIKFKDYRLSKQKV